MDATELDKKIQGFIDEMRGVTSAISKTQLSIVHRLDTLDLNGSASYLREFGNFLKEHPDFMKREAAQESQRVRDQIAMAWIAEKLHLTDFRKKATWMLTALLTGILLTFGSSIVSLLNDANSLFHTLGHAMFK